MHGGGGGVRSRLLRRQHRPLRAAQGEDGGSERFATTASQPVHHIRGELRGGWGKGWDWEGVEAFAAPGKAASPRG